MAPFHPSARCSDAGTSDIVFVKDRQGRYVFANPAAEAITKMPPGD
ncbi:PAS domain-containing protein [Comamonas sp. JC664]